MKRAGRIAAALLALAAWLTALAESVPSPTHTVLYFYRNYCEACAPEEEFAGTFRSVTGVSLDACDFTAWNVVRSDGQAALEAFCTEHGLENAALPLAVVDGEIYPGASSMNAELAKTALAWHDTLDSEVLFFYVPACESCARVEAALDALPESVRVRRGDVEFDSAVRVRRVDISGDPGYAKAMFDAYAVPDDARVTPIVFFADRWLSGAEAIESRLARQVELGWASGGVPRIEEANTPSPAGTLAQSVVAGLVAGLNTCALSMLLLFVSLVLESGRRAIGPVIGFLTAKLACYLLIGFALAGLFQRFNPAWLRPLARWAMTALGLILAALNISDGLHARRSDLGGVKNQLPGGMRGALRRIIQRLTRSRALIPASALLGLIVAGGEFMCAGQLYLMQLMATVQAGGGYGLRLVAYCMAFLTPSAAVCALVLAGGSHLRAAGFFAGHMASIKFLTAAAMLAMIAAAWLI